MKASENNNKASILDIEPILKTKKINKIKNLTEKEKFKMQPWKLKLNFSDESVTFHKTKEKLISYYNNLDELGSADVYRGYLNEYGMLRYKHNSYFREND